MDHSDIDHDNFKSAYLKVLGINNDQEESIDEARLITKDGKFIVMTDNDTEAATFEDRESALEYIKNNKDKLSVRDEKTKVTTDKVEAKEGKEIFIVPEEIVDTKERNAFMGAAAAAHKAGKSHFNFGGKKHKVTMSKDTARAVNSSVKEAEVKYPHAMYDPKTGEKVMAKTPADHNKYDKMGYTHDKPKMDENNPQHYAAIAKNNARRNPGSQVPNMNDPKFKMTKKDKPTKDPRNPTGALVGVREYHHDKVNSSANPMSKLTPTQRQALSRMKVKKKGDVTLPGMDLLKKAEKPKMKPGRQSQIVRYEGYEADVSKFMNKHGIDHHWSGGKLHVDKKDHAHAEKKLKKKYGGYGPRGAKMMPQLHVNKESTNMVTRSNWVEKFYEKRDQVNEAYKESPHAGGDDTRDTYAKQLSTRKGEEAFVKMHEPHTPEYADGPAVVMKTFKDMTSNIKGPKYRSNDNTQGDKSPVPPVNVGKAGAVGAKD